MNKVDRAWMFYLGSIKNISYLYMLLNTYVTLKNTGTKYPIYCGVTKNIDKDTIKLLNKIGLNTILLDTYIIENSTIFNSTANMTMTQHYIDATTKLAILNSNIRDKFNKIVYIDSDIWIKKNMDELFDKPHMSAIEDEAPVYNKTAWKYTKGMSIFCAGLFVWDFEHNPNDGSNILTMLNTLDISLQWHDQNILNYYYKNWQYDNELHLSPGYSLMNGKKEFQLFHGDIKCVHMVDRLRSGWPFTKKTRYIAEGKLFIEWLNEINNSLKYLNSMYGLSIEYINVDNISMIGDTKSQAYGRAGYYLAF